jgi:hypothetical protein
MFMKAVLYLFSSSLYDFPANEIQSAIVNIRESASLQTNIENNESLIELVKDILNKEHEVSDLL